MKDGNLTSELEDSFDFIKQGPILTLVLLLLFSIGYKLIENANDVLTFATPDGNVRSINTNTLQSMIDSGRNIDDVLIQIGLEYEASHLDFEHNVYILNYSLDQDASSVARMSPASVLISKNPNGTLSFTYFVYSGETNRGEEEITASVGYGRQVNRYQFLNTVYNLTEGSNQFHFHLDAIPLE